MKTSGSVLLIDDNIGVLDANSQVLAHDGYTVLSATTLAEARKLLMSAAPDVVVLEVMLPDGNGLDFMQELRKLSTAPVLFLTTKDKPEERMAGLLAGGNDYITKPYDIYEFRIRVKNFIYLLREARDYTSTIAIGSLKLDTVAQHAFLDGENLGLAPKEFALLNLLVKNKNITLSTEYLYEKAWGQPICGDTYSVKKAVSKLRLKLENSEFSISTHRGSGYCLHKRSANIA